MLDFLACIAVASLTAVRAEMPHAALTLHSSVGRKPCKVQYVVLHASISSPCLDQCSLLLASTAQPQLESVQSDSGLDVFSASTLLSTNVVTFQRSADKQQMMQISCQADNDCIASPKSWQIENVDSGLVVAARGASQYPASTSRVSCVQELNSTVNIAVSGKAASIVTPQAGHHLGVNAVFVWSIRGAVLASVVILQLTSR